MSPITIEQQLVIPKQEAQRIQDILDVEGEDFEKLGIKQQLIYKNSAQYQLPHQICEVGIEIINHGDEAAIYPYLIKDGLKMEQEPDVILEGNYIFDNIDGYRLILNIIAQ